MFEHLYEIRILPAPMLHRSVPAAFRCNPFRHTENPSRADHRVSSDDGRQGAILQRTTPGLSRMLYAVLTFILFTVLVSPAWGQDTLRLARLSGPVVIDGRVDEPA